MTTQPKPVFSTEAERKVAQVTYEVIKKYENLPSSTYLLQEEVQQKIVAEVAEAVAPVRMELAGIVAQPDIAAIVQKTTSLLIDRTIDIPRIVVIPKGEVAIGYHPFKLDTSGTNLLPVSRDLVIQHLRTRQQEMLSLGGSLQPEQRLEDYIVRGLVDFDDISYDDHADLLYDLAGQMVAHLKSYLSEEDTRNVLIYYQKQIAAFIHVQMQTHQWEKATDYAVEVKKGFTELKESAYTKIDGEPVHDFRQTVEDKMKIGQILFGGFSRCLYGIQKFQSDSERKLAIILDRDALKWFKPAKGQFQIFYKSGADLLEYQPDFVVETKDCTYLLEAKARNEMDTPDVQAKKDVALTWCGQATAHTQGINGKPWKYVLIPHDVIAENMTLEYLAQQFVAQS